MATMLILVLLNFSLVGCMTYSKMNYTGYKVIKVDPKTKQDLVLLKNIAKSHLVEPWNNIETSRKSVLIQLNPLVIKKVERRLKLAGIPFTTVYDDLQRAINKEILRSYSAVKIPSKGQSLNFDFSVYHKLGEINRYLLDVGKKYKSLVKVISIGKTFESRQILGIHISVHGNRNKPAVVLEHGIHAREWISPATALYFINELVTKAKTDYKKILNKYDFYIIPVLNPDGYVYSHRRDRFWRKTRSKKPPSTCAGVDLNRNFDIHHCESQPKHRCGEIFCGEYPFSETEAVALRDFVLDRKGNIKLYISLHSFGQMWMVPYGYKRTLPPNYMYLEKLAQIGLEAVTAVHGTKYRFGTINRLLYKVAGGSLDWVYEIGNVSLSYTIELRDDYRYGFMLPEDQIIPTAEEIWAGIVAIVKAM